MESYLSLKSNNLPISHWENVLPQALHSIRSLLCTATNSTPHERFFTFNRRSETGITLPSWLTNPGAVLMKKNVRTSKYDPLVEEVYLLESNPQYALIRHKDGKESTVNVRQLAPPGENQVDTNSISLEEASHSNNNIVHDIPIAVEEAQIISQNSETTTSTSNQNETTGHEEESFRECTVPEAMPPTSSSPSQSLQELANRQGRLHSYNLRNRVV